MMTGMKAYYLSRAAISIAFGTLFALSGSAWWAGVLVAVVAFGWFLVAPHTGRYAVHPELGVTALRRDERSELINDKAGRNAFVVTAIALAGLILYSGATAAAGVALHALEGLLILGLAVYYVSDLWLRRTSS
jgi:hypothetical protein